MAKTEIFTIGLDGTQYLNVAKKLQTEIVKLTKEQKAMRGTAREVSSTFVQNASDLKELKANYNNAVKGNVEYNNQLKATSLLTKNVNVELKKEVVTINEANQQITRLNKVKKSLNVNNKEEKALLDDINKRIDQNTDFVKENSSSIEKQKINIGNYTSALDGVSPRLSGWIKQGMTLVTGLQAQKTALKSSTSSLKVFKIALASTGIGLLITALGALAVAFSKSQKLIDKVNVAFAGVGAVVNTITDRFIKVGEVLSNVFNQSIFKTITDVTGAFKGMGDEMEREVSLFVELEKASQRLRDLEIEQTAQQAERLVAIEQLRFAAKDELATMDERVGKLKLAQQLEQQTMKEQVANATERLRIFQADVDNTNTTIEDKKKLAELTADVSLATVNSMKKQRTLEAELQSLQKRGRTKALAESKAKTSADIAESKRILDEKVKNIGIELQTYKINNEVKLQDDAKLNDDFVKSKLAYLSVVQKMEQDQLAFNYQNELLTKSEYDLKKLELDTEYNNQRTELNLQFKEAESLREQEELEEKREKRALEFELQVEENKLKRQTEYEAKLEDESLQYENDTAILNEKLLNKEITKEEHKRRLAIIEKKHIKDVTKLNEDKVKYEEKLERAKNKAIIADASHTFGQLATLFGEGSKVGQAFAIAQATMSGYQAVLNAYTTAQKSPITVLNPAYPYIQAGIAGAFGVAQVAKVAGVKFEKGGLTQLEGKRHSQGGEQIYVGGRHVGEMEGGEVFGVMSRQASRKFLQFNNENTDGAQTDGYFENGGSVSALTASSVVSNATGGLNIDAVVNKINAIKVVNNVNDTSDLINDNIEVENVANL